MAVFAVSAAWAGVIGTALGGFIAFMTSWLVHRMERADRVAERSHAERRELYGAFLANAEDSMHLFQWLAEGHFSPAGSDADKQRANFFYDQEVTPRLMMLRIVGTPNVVESASEMRRALNDLRHVMTDAPTLPSDESPDFRDAHHRYRQTRSKFIELAHADLDEGGGRRVRLRS
jgi:hypothetical protein